MTKEFDIQEYMTKGVENIVASSLKATIKNPKESAFMLKFAKASKAAAKIRQEYKQKGEHIPPFLIASITSSCNLHCAGCYSRCNNATNDEAPVNQLSSEEWAKIFDEADGLGMSYILLAGGEPMLRRDVIKKASEYKNIIFPIFTNGTYIDEKYMDLFDRSRNLIPVISIEGGRDNTDIRRGDGVYDRVIANMNALNKRNILFGASVTVTSENIEDVLSYAFADTLYSKGCKLIVYVEFVPVTDVSSDLAPQEEHREYMKERLSVLRDKYSDMVFVSFPGDEKSSGGCIAAGRGFFHINSHGGAEPCPFSPYSDVNVRDTSLLDAMHSKLFTVLRDGDYLKEDHAGGCVLYEKRSEVEHILSSNMW